MGKKLLNSLFMPPGLVIHRVDYMWTTHFLSWTLLGLFSNPTLSLTSSSGAVRAMSSLRMATAGHVDPLLLRAARGEEVERVPVWMMRQAGRHMKASELQDNKLNTLLRDLFHVSSLSFRYIESCVRSTRHFENEVRLPKSLLRSGKSNNAPSD
jgi:hypothetical protein